jgi:hypothetical protein
VFVVRRTVTGARHMGPVFAAAEPSTGINLRQILYLIPACV